MRSRHRRERAKESAIIVFAVAVLLGVFGGVWGFIGWELRRLGPWGMALTAVLVAAQVVLLGRKIDWGLRLFACAFAAIVMLGGWKYGHWWGLGLTVLVSIVVAVGWIRSTVRERTSAYSLRGTPRKEDWDALRFRRTAGGSFSMDYDDYLDSETRSVTIQEGWVMGYFQRRSDPAESHPLLHELASGRFPEPKEVHRRSAGGTEARRSTPVDCTVFAPDHVRRQDHGLVQVFLHVPEDRKKAQTAAKRADRSAEERGHRSLVLDAPFGTVFAFEVEIEGLELPQSRDTLLWTGQPQSANFSFAVPKRSRWGRHIGTVVVTMDGAPIGRITFQIEVSKQHAGGMQPVGDDARHYYSCFCSYSTLDRAEMLKREQGLRAAGLETFVDAVSLRPGDVWSPKIFDAIEQSDLFVLIWSHNARASQWVRKETNHALKCRQGSSGPDFRPIPIEGPPIAPVPRRLRAFNFNDERLLLIRQAELEAAERESVGAREKRVRY